MDGSQSAVNPMVASGTASELIVHASRSVLRLESSQQPDTLLKDVHVARRIAHAALRKLPALEVAWHVVVSSVLARCAGGDALHLLRPIGLECLRVVREHNSGLSPLISGRGSGSLRMNSFSSAMQGS